MYTYDWLNQVASFNRGVGARTQSFDYDALGNRSGVTTNGSTQTYTANKQNEITSISGATTPTYDGNGNMTGDETGKLFVYDAWNRLVAVKNSGGTVLKTCGYDSLNHRVSETVSGTTTDLYYSAGWQVLEERVGGVTRVSNVWSPVYVDAMIARDRDTDTNGTLDERLYATHDANFNVTGLINTSGAVVERYVYDAYGAVTVLNGSWTVLGGSAYAWVYLHQGGRADAVSGLVHFRNRDYSVTLGRWVTMDPMGYAAGDVDLYRYESNSSLNSLDPSGLDGFEWLARRFNPSSVEESDRLDRQRAEQQSRRTEQEIPTQGLSMGSYDRMFGSTSSSMRQAGGYIDRIGGSVADGVLDGMTQLAPMFLSAKFVNGNKLCYDKGSKAWTSSGGLVYGQGSVHGNRVKHVLAHTVAQPNNPKHTVFKVATPGDVIGLLDRAWAKKKGTVPNDPMSYIIDMGEVIGTAGETKIKIVVNRGTSEIITAYPFK